MMRGGNNCDNVKFKVILINNGYNRPVFTFLFYKERKILILQNLFL